MTLIPFLAASLVASLSSSAQAKDTHIVYDFRATVVRHVPDQDLPLFKQSFFKHTIQARGHYYIAAECAVDTIKRLAVIPGVKISFLSEFDGNKTPEILEKIGLGGIAYKQIGADGLTEAKGNEIPNDGSGPPRFFKDLTKVTADISDAVLVSPDMPIIPAAQAGNTLKIGPNYYYYESYEKSLESEEVLKKSDPSRYSAKKPRFPVDKAAWQADRDKFVWQFAVLKRAIAASKASGVNFLLAVQAEAAKSRDEAVQYGLAELGADADCVTRYQK